MAVELARDVSADDPQPESAIAAVFPVIELHDMRFGGSERTAAETIAGNALNVGFVCGASRSLFQPIDDARLAISVDNELAAECVGPELTIGVSTSVRWLSRQLARIGGRLRAGDIVLTGSLPRLIPISEQAVVRVATSHFGEVSARFIG